MDNAIQASCNRPLDYNDLSRLPQLICNIKRTHGKAVNLNPTNLEFFQKRPRSRKTHNFYTSLVDRHKTNDMMKPSDPKAWSTWDDSPDENMKDPKKDISIES